MVPLVEDKIIMQPFGDRSKVVIEPMLTDQWFVDTAKIVGPALDAVRDGRMSTSCPSSTARSISTGWRTSSPGASRASSGGGIRSRSGTGFDLGASRLPR
jgi:valyl-tRNA synthetase